MKKSSESPDKNTDEFNLLRELKKSPNASQRLLANELGISVGKINYCLRALQKKGLIKINNFKKSNNKLKYLYYLTPEGISFKSKLTINFMKKKLKEYDELKLEYEELKKEIKKID